MNVVENQTGTLSSITQFHHIPSHLAPSFNIDPRKEDAPVMVMTMMIGSSLPLVVGGYGYGYGRDGS
jgi:hypothetical protein